MLRPATPLSILFFAAFALLLLATLSTPIISAIPLATFQGVNFGVFGYCQGTKCSGIRIGYNTDGIFSTAADEDFSLPAATRHSLTNLLIVHPVAALLTLICLGLSIAAHFHSPAHSPRYLLALLILTFPTLLVCLLAFLVDILLFVPHMAWGGWIVLAATILIVASGVVTCAMRRTLVSRKARKKRIAENAEMNGQNFYGDRIGPGGEILPKAESPPPLSMRDTVLAQENKMPGFATFELQKQQPQDDMTPLNPRNPSMKSNGSNGRSAASGTTYNDELDRLPDPSRAPSGRRPPRDQYGNIIPPLPGDGYGPPPMAGRGSMRQGPNGPMGPGGRGGMYPPRGRGGYPPRGRGGYPPRGGYGPGGPQGMRGPPPPGWNGGGRGGMGPPGPVMMGAGMMGRGQRGPPPGYDNGFYNGQPPREQSPGGFGARRPPPPGSMQPPMPIGEARGMGMGTATPPQGGNYAVRDSDSDVQGMLALQQGLMPPPGRRNSTGPISPGSAYSSDEYVPPRANWNQQQPPPLTQNNSDNSVPSSNSRGLSPIQASPVELPAQLAKSPNPSVHAGNNSANYYEDVDPQFAAPLPPASTPPVSLPTALVPGGPSNLAPYLQNNSSQSLSVSERHLDRRGSYEDDPEGSRSPAASETSHFTSVSQRGVNPNWRPPPGGGPQYGGYGPRRPPRQEDVILEANAANPDFSVPGVGPPRNLNRDARGGRRESLRQPGMIPAMPGAGGRYPGAEAV